MKLTWRKPGHVKELLTIKLAKKGIEADPSEMSLKAMKKLDKKSKK